MLRFDWKLVLLVIVMTTIAACDSGGAAAPSPTETRAAAATSPAVAATTIATTAPAATTPAVTTVPSAAPTSAPSGAGGTAAPTSTPAAVNTPNNVVPTVDPKAANTSFQTAKALGKDPLKVSFKDSEFFYKIDIARGGIVSVTLAVDAFSPQPAQLTVYDEKQAYINDITVPVARSSQFKHIFGAKGGGTVYLALKGNSSVTLTGQALTQNDGGTQGDAGDDADSAKVVALGKINGLIGDDDHEDDYVVNLDKAGGVLNTAIQTTDGSVKLTIYDENRAYVADVSADKNNPAAGVFQHVLAAGQGGRWFLSVTGSGTYTLNAAFGSQNDGGSGKDAGSDFDTALAQKLGPFSGLVGAPDNDDFYSFDLGKTGGVFTVSLKTADGAVKATVYDSGQHYIGDFSADKSQGTPAAFRFVLDGAQGGKWYVDVSGAGSYSAVSGFVPQNDGGSGADAGDSSDTAAVPKTGTFTGTLGDADATDYYKITASFGRKLNVQYPNGTGALKIALYDKDDNYLKDTSLNKGESVDLVEDSGLTTDYFIVVSGGNGDYSIKVTP